MDFRTRRITQELQKHDRSLYAIKSESGMFQVWRKADKWSAADVDVDESGSNPTQFILALTDTWTLKGNPVEWGLDPIMRRIQEMDLWTKESFLDNLRKERARSKELRERATKNEMKARAYDMRKEFAQATNEINTSTLEKVDNRRTRYGNS